MVPENWKKEIINIHKDIDWLTETVEQLCKDFEMAGVSILSGFDESNNYQQIFTKANEKLKKLHDQDYGTFQNLLYRIDLPEDMLQSLKPGSGNDYFDQLTELVLRREFLKVVYKHKYSH